jgi:zinc and cadmium transporter
MSTLLWITLATLACGLGAALVASAFLLLDAPRRARAVPHLVSFAIGALLGAAFLGLLPHAIASAGIAAVHGVGLAFALGILSFFALEKAVIWRHCHTHDCEMHGGAGPGHDHGHGAGEGLRELAAGRLILVGDGLHNFLDGVLIGAAFLTDPGLGIVTALAVAAHELPQEVGDLAVLLHGGFSARRAFIANLAVGTTTLLGGLVAYFALAPLAAWLPYVLAVAAGSFVYVAVADLIPGLHRRTAPGAGVGQVALILAGLALIHLTHASSY